MVTTTRNSSTTEITTFRKGNVQLEVHRKDDTILSIEFPLCAAPVSPRLIRDMYDVLALTVAELKKYDKVEASDE